MRALTFIALLALAGCKKEAVPKEEAAPTPGPVAVVKSPRELAAEDAGAAPVLASKACKDAQLSQPDGGLNAFVGFSKDEQRFAFSVYSDGAGAYLLSVIEAPNKLLQRLTLGGSKEEPEAKKLLDEGGFSGEGYEGNFDAKLEGATVHVLAGGQEVWSGEPFGGMGAGNVRIRPWGCSPSKKRGAIEATVPSGTEFGDIKTYVIFDLPGAK